MGSEKPQVVEIVEKLGNNVAMFGLFAFGDTHFRQSYSMFHRRILEAVMENVKVGIAAPRGHGKTTVIAFLYVIFCIVFKKKRHIILLQNTLSKSTTNLATIKYEIENNTLLSIFGIKIKKDTKEEAIFEHSDDGFSVRVLCKGYEQKGSIRGEKFRAWRPDLIIVDDLEEDKTVQNPELRRECERIFNDAVDPAIDYQAGGQLIFIGTILHDDCLIAKVISRNEYLEFKKYKFKALNEDEDGKEYALWEDRYSVEDLKAIEADDAIKFAKEYQNDPISGARRQFHESDFRMWNIQEGNAVLYNEDMSIMSVYDLKDCKAAIGCDLAWSEKKEADDSVLMPGILTPGDEILLDYYVAKKGMRPDEFEDILFDMVEKYEKITGYIVEVGFEKAMLEKVTKWLLGKAMKKREKYLVLKDMNWDKDKITRIVTALQPRYVNHTIFHRKKFGTYEHQLLRIPSGTHDDIVDSAQSVVRLLKYRRGKKKVLRRETEIQWIMRMRSKQSMDVKKEYVFGGKEKKQFFPFKTKKSFR